MENTTNKTTSGLNENKNENKFVSGMFVKKQDNSPEWVIANLSISTDKFIEWLNENTNAKGFCNIDIKKSKLGMLYASLNEWKPEEKFVKNEDGTIGVEEYNEEDVAGINPENIPF